MLRPISSTLMRDGGNVLLFCMLLSSGTTNVGKKSSMTKTKERLNLKVGTVSKL